MYRVRMRTKNMNKGARVAELVDAPDLGSGALAWGFDSPLSHQDLILYAFNYVVNSLSKARIRRGSELSEL